MNTALRRSEMGKKETGWIYFTGNYKSLAMFKSRKQVDNMKWWYRVLKYAELRSIQDQCFGNILADDAKYSHHLVDLNSFFFLHLNISLLISPWSHSPSIITFKSGQRIHTIRALTYDSQRIHTRCLSNINGCVCVA